MGLTKKQADEIREELDNCQNPVFFFHDDPDGLCSFLQLYLYKKEGHGVIVKSLPKLTAMFARKVEEYHADKVFITDIAIMDEEFADAVKAMKVPIIWIDHHTPQHVEGIKYFNPRIRKPHENYPASYLCYQVTGGPLWIAAAGTISDWVMLPDFSKEFSEKYPELLPPDVTKPEQALYATELGKLIRILAFILKGRTGDVMKSVKVLTRIKEPSEILGKTTAQGKFIYKHFTSVNHEYEKLLEKIKQSKEDSGFIISRYSGDSTSFTKELSNQMLYLNPDKVIMIARESSGEVKLSIRSSGLLLPPLVNKALHGVEGYGGGHEHACGACVKKEDYDKFMENFRSAVNEAKG